MARTANSATDHGRQAVAALLEQLRAEAAAALATCERWFDGDDEACPALGASLAQLEQVARLAGLDGLAALAGECRESTATMDASSAGRQAIAEGLVALGGHLANLAPGDEAPVSHYIADLNKLRVARGASPIPESDQFIDRLVRGGPYALPTPSGGATGMAQYAVAARVLEPAGKIFTVLRRDGDQSSALEALRKLTGGLERAAREPDELLPWWIARILVDHLHAGRLPLDAAAKALLEALKPMIAALAEKHAPVDGAQWTYRALFLLAPLGRADEELGRIFDVFALDPPAADTGPARATSSAGTARSAVADAAREELARVRDAFDVFLRSGAADTNLLKPAVARLDGIVAPLQVADLGDAAELLADARTSLAALVDGQPLGNAANMIADRLLQAEELLGAGAEGPADKLRAEALRALVDAANDVLASVRQALFEAAEIDDHEALGQVPASLANFAGALSVAGLGDAAALATDIAAATDLIPSDRGALELLAEAMVCLELYLGAHRDRDSVPPELLDRAREVLGRAVPEGALAKRAAAEAEPPIVGEDSDPALLEIYLEEARECVATARTQFEQWRAQPDDAGTRVDLQRAFHTLKGSGRMVGALRTAEFSRSFEEVLERVEAESAPVTPGIVDLVGAALSVLPALLEQIESGREVGVPLVPLQKTAGGNLAAIDVGSGASVLAATAARETAVVHRWLDAVAAGNGSGAVPPAVIDALQELEAVARIVADAGIGESARALRERLEGAAGIDDALQRDVTAVLDRMHAQAAPTGSGDGVDPGTAAAYHDEAHALLDRMGEACDALLRDAADADAVLSMQRILHTLKGASRAAGFRALSDVAHTLEAVLRAVAQEQMVVTPRLIWTLQRVFDAMYGMLEPGTAERAAERAGKVIDELRQLSGDDRSLPPASSGADRRRRPRVAAESERVRSDQFDRALVRALSLGLRSSELDRKLREQTMWDMATIGDALAALAADAAAIRDLLVRARVAPLHTHASRWRRTVRQAAEDTGKEVELRFEGSDNELDRRLLDALVMPLEHLLRNAVAHGIESTFARRAAGKPASGVIIVRAIPDSQGVSIEIDDDGAGIDVDKVRRVARERGLTVSDGELSMAKLLGILTTPGFSTAAAVTHASGYGMGMDTVAAGIRELGGRLELMTTPGQGSRFILHLPNPSPVLAVELVRAGSALVALSPGAVVATRAVEQGAQSVQHDGEEWPLLDLAGCLGLDGAQASSDAATVVLLRSNNLGVAVLVDEHLGHVETAMHRLRPGDLREGVCVAGVGLLDGGRLATVLNIDAAIAAAPGALKIRPFAFVADDSTTARDEVIRKLERQGWRVEAVEDGTAAKAALTRARPELIVLDIDMPGSDGLAVVEWLRTQPEHASTPVILCSARLDDARRDRARALSVAACVTKPFEGTEFEDALSGLGTSRA
ncbi:MAG: Hpt domain-containing protein [Gammaproteobacteria bacterium]